MAKRQRFSIPHVSNAPFAVHNGAIDRIVVAMPNGYHIVAIDVTTGAVAFERTHEPLPPIAKKPKRKAGR